MLHDCCEREIRACNGITCRKKVKKRLELRLVRFKDRIDCHDIL